MKTTSRDPDQLQEKREPITVQLLLASAAVASLAGVLLPAYWAPWAEAGHAVQPFILPIVAVLFAVHLASVVRVGYVRNLPGRGLAIVAIDIVLGVVATFATWFIVTPMTLVGMWLAIAAFGLVSKTNPARRNLVVAATIVVVVSLATSLALPALAAYGAVVAVVIHAFLAGWLTLLCCRVRGNGSTGTPE